MKNIINVDIRTSPYLLGYANEGCSNNLVAINFITNQNLVSTYIEIIKVNGETELIEYNGTTDIDFSIFQTKGVIQLRLLANGFESEYINIKVLENIQSCDNAIVKLNNDELEIRKIRIGTSNYITGLTFTTTQQTISDEVIIKLLNNYKKSILNSEGYICKPKCLYINTTDELNQTKAIMLSEITVSNEEIKFTGSTSIKEYTIKQTNGVWTYYYSDNNSGTTYDFITEDNINSLFN